jgi:hypothetical protein
VNGSSVTIGAVVVVVVEEVEEVVDVEVVLDAGVELDAGAPDPFAGDPPSSVSVEPVSLSPVHAASAAATVPARNPRLVRWWCEGGSLTPASTHGRRRESRCRLGRR